MHNLPGIPSRAGARQLGARCVRGLGPMQAGYWRSLGEAALGWLMIAICAALGARAVPLASDRIVQGLLALLAAAWTVLWPAWRLTPSPGRHRWARAGYRATPHALAAGPPGTGHASAHPPKCPRHRLRLAGGYWCPPRARHTRQPNGASGGTGRVCIEALGTEADLQAAHALLPDGDPVDLRRAGGGRCRAGAEACC